MLATLRGWRRCERGATAVEFALIAVPFLALLTAMVETALVFFAGQVLQASTSEAGRLIMTGQAQAMTSSQFQQAVCDRSSGLFNCAQLSVNVQTFGTFTSAAGTNPIVGGKLNTSGFGFSPGKPGQIEVVQVFYPWPLGIDLLGLNLNNVNGDSHLLTATAVFRNEPY
jgi:Flp pilus assembly protein TadG